jgi:hypothetical protein
MKLKCKTYAKGSAKSVHRDLNKLRVKLALSKDSSLVKLPPSEAAIRQHILRVAFQVYVWTHANENLLTKLILP